MKLLVLITLFLGSFAHARVFEVCERGSIEGDKTPMSEKELNRIHLEQDLSKYKVTEVCPERVFMQKNLGLDKSNNPLNLGYRIPLTRYLKTSERTFCEYSAVFPGSKRFSITCLL